MKFCAIYSSNLDEFFMVRVAGLHDQVDAGIEKPRRTAARRRETIDGDPPRARASTSRARRALLERDAAPGARRARDPHRRLRRASTRAERDELDERFRRQIFPVLTPLAVGLGRPFPYISNLSLSLARARARPGDRAVETFARVKVPKEMLPRFVPVGDGRTFVPLEDVIAEHLDALFPGMEIVDYDVFRVTRDADFTVSDEADDLLQAVEDELRRAALRRGRAASRSAPA